MVSDERDPDDGNVALGTVQVPQHVQLNQVYLERGKRPMPSAPLGFRAPD